MTPDKVEAALGVFKDAIRYEVRAEAAPGWIAELREALATLTSALAERERDAARYRWLRSIEIGPVYIEHILFETISDDHSPPYRSLKHTFDLDTAIDAAMKEPPHAR